MQKIILKGFFLFIMLSSMVLCGDMIIEEVSTFGPNQAPEVQGVQALDQSSNLFVSYSGTQRTFSSGDQLEPGRIYYLTINIEEAESDLVFISYSASSYLNVDPNPGDSDYTSHLCAQDISGLTPNVASIGTFNKALQSTDYQPTVTATVTYAVPTAPPLLVDSDIYVTVDTVDDKDAESSYTFCLGAVKRTPVMTEVSYGGGDSSTLAWSADSNGNYILRNDATCAIANTTAYPYLEGQTVQRATPVAGSPFTVVLYDSMQQFACVTH